MRGSIRRGIGPIPGTVPCPRVNRCNIGEFRISDTYTDHVMIERTVSRISRDHARGIGFTLFLDGDAHLTSTLARNREYRLCRGSILATDLEQPVRVQRQACRSG
jgi:hypothetical protein